MGFSDMIKKSVLEGFQSGDLLTTSILASLGMAAAMGLFIYFIYRTTTRSGFYNRGFNKSLAVLPVITAGIMLAMQSNLVISLGMVGALSIVRFRNAVKDPVDLTYLFWSISMGIIVGAGLFELAILLSLVATVLVVVLDLIPTVQAPCLLIVSGDLALEGTLMKAVREICPRAKVRSRNVTKRGVEWIMELAVRDEAKLMERLRAIDGIASMNLMSHEGDVRF